MKFHKKEEEKIFCILKEREEEFILFSKDKKRHTF